MVAWLDAQKAEALKSTDSKRATPRISFKNETWYQKIYSSLARSKTGNYLVNSLLKTATRQRGTQIVGSSGSNVLCGVGARSAFGPSAVLQSISSWPSPRRLWPRPTPSSLPRSTAKLASLPAFCAIVPLGQAAWGCNWNYREHAPSLQLQDQPSYSGHLSAVAEDRWATSMRGMASAGRSQFSG